MQFLIQPRLKLHPGIYAIRSAIDTRVYIGSASHLHSRYQAHISLLTAGKHHSGGLQSFADFNGLDSLSFELLQLAQPGDDLRSLEQRWLSDITADGTALFNSATKSVGKKTVTTSGYGKRPPQIAVSLTEQEKDFFERIAAKRGMKTAALLRSLAYDEGHKLGLTL